MNMLKLKDYELINIDSNNYTPINEDYPEEHMDECRDIKFVFKSVSNSAVAVSFESFIVSYYETPYTLTSSLKEYITGFLMLAHNKKSEAMTLSEFTVWFINSFVDKAIKLKITMESKEYNMCILKGDNCSPVTASEIAFTLYDLDNSHWRDTKSKMKSVLETLDTHGLVSIAKDKNTVAVCSAQEFLETLKL